MDVATIIFTIVAVSAIGFALGFLFRKIQSERTILSAKNQASKIISDAQELAETRKKELILEGKDEIHRFRAENERDISERRKELQKQESRIIQKEENIDKKSENLELKEKNLNKKERDIEAKYREAEIIKKNQFEMLEKISGLTKKQARDFLLESLQEPKQFLVPKSKFWLVSVSFISFDFLF